MIERMCWLWVVVGVCGCIERRAPGVDGVEPDAAVDRGVDAGGRDVGAGDVAVGADGAVDLAVDAAVDAALDAGVDAAVDAADAMVDAAPVERWAGELRVAESHDRTPCPTATWVDDGWMVGVVTDDAPRDGRRAADVQVLRVAVDGAVTGRWSWGAGPWSTVSGLRLVGEAGALVVVDREGLWWAPLGEADVVRVGEGAPGAVDGAVGAGGVAVVHGLGGGLRFARLVDGALGAGPQLDADTPDTVRLVPAAGGYVAGWVRRRSAVVAALDAEGAERWRVELAVVGGPIGLRVEGEAVEVGYLADDPRLAELSFSAGHGQPRVRTLSLAAGAEQGDRALVEAVVRGGPPSLGPGPYAAWPRLRVDGDRNRAEVELTVGDTVRRLTRAHGFSFCPTLAGAHGERVLVTWLDTREGREDPWVYVGSAGEAPLDDVPEPTPTPPVPPGACGGTVLVVEAPVLAFDGVGARGRMWLGWVERAVEGAVTLGTGFMGAAGAASVDRWVVPAPVEGVQVAWLGERGVLGASGAGRFTVWVEGARAVEGEGELVALAGDGERLWAVRRQGEAASVVGLSLDGVVTPLGAGFVADEAALMVVGRRPVLARVEGGVVRVEQVEVDGSRVDLWRGEADLAPRGVQAVGAGARGGVAYAFHRGRAYARDIRWVEVVEGGAEPVARVEALPGDPGSSTSPAIAAGAGGWWLGWSEERPVERALTQAVWLGGEGDGMPERVAVGGVAPGSLRMAALEEGPLWVWRTGSQLVAQVTPAACRVPGATAP